METLRNGPAPAQDSDTSLKSGIERRRSTREPVRTVGMVRSLDGGEYDRPRQVMVNNVSLHGVGFRCMERLDNDLIYIIEIGVGPLHLTSQFKIVRNRVCPDGTYDVGAEFI